MKTRKRRKVLLGMRLGLLTDVTYSARKERSTPVQSAAVVLPTRDSPNHECGYCCTSCGARTTYKTYKLVLSGGGSSDCRNVGLVAASASVTNGSLTYAAPRHADVKWSVHHEHDSVLIWLHLWVLCCVV